MTFDSIARHGSYDMVVCNASTATTECVVGNESGTACGVLCSLGRASRESLATGGDGIESLGHQRQELCKEARTHAAALSAVCMLLI